MANEKVYVGEEGAQELYRRIKSLIPVANSWKQWSEEHESSGTGNSVYLGESNVLLETTRIHWVKAILRQLPITPTTPIPMSLCSVLATPLPMQQTHSRSVERIPLLEII